MALNKKTINDISTFRRERDVLDGFRCIIVVKSQDQIERRKRMIESRIGNKFGRIKPRPTSIGLVAEGVLEKEGFCEEKKYDFREPRHIYPLEDNTYFLCEIDKFIKIDNNGNILSRYRNPFFAFLHTIDVRRDGKRALIVSSGYDAVFEIDLLTGAKTFSWFSWDHGFNPDEDGNWLTTDPKILKNYKNEGKTAILIRPEDYGESGLMTAKRTAHPNMAVYDPYDEEKSFIVGIGHNGELYRVNLNTGHTKKVFSVCDQMPHGLCVFNGGWCITNTVKGKYLLLSKDFMKYKEYSIAKLNGKVQGTEDVEWIQKVIPIDENNLLFIDANRGIIAVDIEKCAYTIYKCNPNWCIQDLVPI